MWPTERPSEGTLKGLLPPKATTDKLVQAYLDNFDCIYHILDLPGFRRQYAELWVGNLPVEENFLVALLLVVAAAMCLTSTTAGEYCQDTVSSRDQATTIIQSCENWLHHGVSGHSDLHDFQISFLLLFARQINARRYKQTWANAGKVVRIFMSAGLHMDPSPAHVDSPAHREIRRRIWASVAEFELQASFEQGMPATPWPLQSDITSLINAFDDDLEPLATIRSPLEFTESSYLATAHQSILFRHALNTLLNDVRATISFHDTKDLTEQIKKYLAAIPLWADRKAAVPRALLFINLHQYQLALHIRQAQRATTPVERNFSTKILLDTAKDMIGLHMAIPERDRGPLEIISGDHIRAALSLCFLWITFDPLMANGIFELSERDVFGLMQEAATLIGAKFSRYGGDQRQLWIVTVATAFMKTRDQPHNRQRFIYEAVQAFTAPFSKYRASRPEGDALNDHETMIGDEPSGQLFQNHQDIDIWALSDFNFDELCSDVLHLPTHS
ncbi:hypothetical protein FDECE_11647 [Fusarium decemcellulare]|nr:hypothetical protein FDECE_11647 [Fusarium decemcellulare]